MKPYYKESFSCRSCGFRGLMPVLSLGEQYISNFVDVSTEQNIKAPLELLLCERRFGGCGLLQLRHTVHPELLYRKQYWYYSGMNKTMQVALRDITAVAKSVVTLRKGDLVLDIGCNDGTLLRSYSTPGLKLVGFEPSLNIAPLAKEGTTQIINEFFNFAFFKKAFPEEKAKIITSIAMFYDLDDPNEFVADIVRCLDSEGLWIIQMDYLPTMFKNNAFDGICHEHIEYYSMMPLEALLQRHGLEIIDVELNDVNGGSFRIYIRHMGSTLPLPKSGAMHRIEELKQKEAGYKLDDSETYLQFSSRVSCIRETICRLIREETSRGKKIYAYGASTKGNTLLQFFKLGADLIPRAIDKNPDKWGKKTVGSNIPIISEEQGRAEKPDYLLILPWHFLEEFIEREKTYLRGGGKFIVPLPEVKVI